VIAAVLQHSLKPIANELQFEGTDAKLTFP
jgi:hypothetical protein